MTNEKLSKLKRSIKHYTPEIIVGASVVAAGIAIVWMKNQSSKPEVDNLVLPNSVFARMNKTGESLLVHHDDYGDFQIKKSLI